MLITGASGFIGSHIVAACLTAGHEVVCAVRSIAKTRERFPQCHIIECDFNRDTEASIWRPRLAGVDAVVNCVGILQSQGEHRIEAIHRDTPCALFQACEDVGVKNIIQISAFGASETAPTAYGQTKFAADQFLSSLSVNTTILRPSLVYDVGSQGGFSLFRRLAGFPLLTLLVGKGEQVFQPIYVNDLARAVVTLLSTAHTGTRIFNAMGPDVLTLKALLLTLRKWLGLGRSLCIKMPLMLMRLSAKLGDVTGIGPMNSTAFKMLAVTQTADPAPFVQAIGFQPQPVNGVLSQHPAKSEDLQETRVYFARPLLRISLGLFWFLSGFFMLTFGQRYAEGLLSAFGLSHAMGEWLLIVLGGFNVLLGLCNVFNFKTKWVGGIQFWLLLLLTFVMSCLFPTAWFDPLGVLLKNIPILMATWVMVALENP